MHGDLNRSQILHIWESWEILQYCNTAPFCHLFGVIDNLLSAIEMGEVALLDRVLLKLALAKDDAELEESINTYLCPVLLKAGVSSSSAIPILQGMCPRMDACIVDSIVSTSGQSL
jgi:hypothetical protein